MADQITIEAQARTALGKKVKALRRNGITPIHVYGSAIASESLQADTFDLVHALNEAGFTTPITVKANGKDHFAIVRHVQRHPITDRLLHVDLFVISRTERLIAEVPITFEGESLAARESGAQVSEDMYHVEIEALPMEMPHELTVDLTSLDNEDSVIYAKDIVLPPGVTLVTDPEATVARIVQARGAQEAEELAEEESAAAAEEAEEAAEEAANEEKEEKEEEE